MAGASQSAHPVQTLHENTRSLESAILVCLAKPRKKAVHWLRTTTRRIEAQLELLTMLPGLAPHKRQRRKALRLLKKLRHAAGQVRDIDVQRELIRYEMASTAQTPRSHRKLLNEARTLRRKLKRQRDDEADSLLRLLKKHQARLKLIFEELLDALAPAESITLSETKLIELVRNWFGVTSDSPSQVSPQDVAHLHQTRKRAKLARYLAESAPESATVARRLAARFEEVQQAGGKWHDWLLLAEVAGRELGDSAKLPQRFAAHAESSLSTYKRTLRHKM